MERIWARIQCEERELDAVHSHTIAFTRTHPCRECDNIGPVIAFDDWKRYEEFKRSLKEE